MSAPQSTPRRRSSARHLTPIAWPTAGSVDAHIRSEQVRAVFQHALFAHVLSIVLALLVGYVLRDAAEPGRVRTWLIVMVVVTVMRASTTIAFRLRNPSPDQMVAWERAFLLTISFSSLAWGVGGWWIMPRDSLAYQAFIYFFLSGIAGGAMANYSAHPIACLLSICCLMLPSTIWFAGQSVLELRVMAIAGTLYVINGFRGLRSFQFFLRRTFLLSWELQEAYGHARELAHTDSLTGLNNRRAFTSLAEKALALGQRHGRPVSVVMFDVDHFKRINDTHGHAAGDLVLQEVADAIRRVVRAPDIAGRLGGEEFAVLSPETTGPQAAILAERLRQEVDQVRLIYEGKTIAFSCSFGVAATAPDVMTFDPLLSRADQALYRAKGQGRNRVSVDQLVRTEP